MLQPGQDEYADPWGTVGRSMRFRARPEQQRGKYMKTSTALAVALGLAALTACKQNPQDNAADNITANADNVADNITATAENQAENIQATAANEAAAVKNEGENKAEAVKDAAENKANALKNAASNTTDNAAEKKKD
jgi:hypothetical protein